MDAEASTAVRQAELTAARRMIDRVQDRFEIWPAGLAADTAYGSAENFAWLVYEKGIEPHIPVLDHSNRRTGSFQRSAFRFEHKRDAYVCPGEKDLTRIHRDFAAACSGVDQDGFM